LLSTGEEQIVVAAQAYSYETNPCIGYIINRWRTIKSTKAQDSLWCNCRQHL